MPAHKNQNVAYHLLDTTQPDSPVDDAQQVGENYDLIHRAQADFMWPHRGRKIRFYSETMSGSGQSSARGACLSSRQLRTLLLLFASLLFLVFLIQLLATRFSPEPPRRHGSQYNLSTYSSVPNAKDQPSPVQNTKPKNVTYVKLKHVLLLNTSKPRDRFGPFKPVSNFERPRYDNYLSSILRNYPNSLDNSQRLLLLDDLLYPADLSEHDPNYRQNVWWKLKYRLNGQYLILQNYVRAMKSFSVNSSITLTTQATMDYLYHTVELCKRWDGPISVAVFCPGVEFPIALSLIKFMRQCLPEPISACVRDKVTWHLVYNTKHGPPDSAISFPRYHMDELNYALFVQAGQCPKLATNLSDIDLVKQFELKLSEKNNLSTMSYRQKFRLTYPINVLRNTARENAMTKYVLASDIELYPSIGMVPQFIRMLKRHDFRREFPQVRRFVFTLPIFETNSNITNSPKTKKELVKLFAQGDAVFFHKWVCDACQNFPNRLKWLEMDSIIGDKPSSDRRMTDELVIFELTRRERSREFWEPIYIGTKDEPEYDDRLSWDGRRDKMGQMYEMCLEGYHLFVLGNAFLVHAPGIKHIDKEDFKNRLDYIRQNNAIYDGTIARLKEQYKLSDQVRVC